MDNYKVKRATYYVLIAIESNMLSDEQSIKYIVIRHEKIVL